MNARGNILSVILVLGVAFFFATFHLKESPPVWYDEGFYVQSAANLAVYGQTGLRVSPETIDPSSKLITVGYPLIYPLAGWFQLFGVSIASARTLMVLFILGLLIASYALVRRLFGNGYALAALALLATLPTLYGNGKSVLGEVPGLLYLVLFLLCLDTAISRNEKKYRWLFASGLLAGICIVTKPTFLVLLPAIAVGTYVAWRRSSLSPKEISLAVGAGILPVFLWIILQFQAGDSLASILSYYANPYQLSGLVGIILENIRRLFISISPLYLVGTTTVWLSAIWIRMRRNEKITVAEIIAAVFSMLIITAYTRTPGWYRYLFEAQVVSLFFFPKALLVTGSAMLRNKAPKKIAFAAVAVLATFGAYQVLFSSFVAETYYREKTAFLETYFAGVSPVTSFFLYNVPEVGIFIRGTNYYQYIDPAGWYIGKEQLPILSEGKVDRVILGADAYASMGKSFPLYKTAIQTHDYIILEKI